MREKFIQINEFLVKVRYRKGMKNIYLRVEKDGTIVVSAPPRTAKKVIEKLVFNNYENIKKRVDIIENRKVINNYESGEEFYIFGKKLELIVIKTKKKYFQITDKNIILGFANETTKEQRKVFLRENLRNLLLQKAGEFIKKYEPKMQVKCQELRVKKMKTRWGTCNITKHRIWINEELVKYPIECLEHVVVHELVHLLETNHTPRFYRLVEKYYPKYKYSESVLIDFAKKVGFY